MNNQKTKNSTKLFFAGVLVLTISNLIIKAIGMLFKIPMNHIVGDQGMGYYSSAYTIYTFFYMISTAGLPVAISLLVSENRAIGRLKQVKKVFKLSIILFFIVGLVGTSVMFFGAKGFASLLKADPTYYCIIAIAPTLFFICLSSAIRGYFQGYQSMVPVAISQLIEAVCKLFLGIAFATYALNKYGSGKETIHYVAAYAVLGLTIGAGLGMLYLMFSKMLFKSQRYDAEYTDVKGFDDSVETSGKILRRIVMIALPVTVSASVMSLTNLIDMALIQRLLQSYRGLTEAQATAVYGNYTSLCVPLFNMPPYLIYPISYSIVPMIKTAVASGDKKRAALVMESSLRVAVIIGIPCALGMAAIAEPILHLFGYRYWSVVSAAPLLALLAPSTFFICVLSVTNAILQANGHERKPVVSMLAGAAVKIVSNTILIRFIGMPGTPISTFLCYLTATGLNIYFIVKHVGLKLKFSRVFFRPLVAGLLCAAVAIGVSGGSSNVLADDVAYEYSVNTTDNGDVININNEYNSAYLHDAVLTTDGTGTDTRDDLKVTVGEDGSLTVYDLGEDTLTVSKNENGDILVDGVVCEDHIALGIDFSHDDILAGTGTQYVVRDGYYTLKIFEYGGEMFAEIIEKFNYEMTDNKLTLSFVGRSDADVTLKYRVDGDTIYLNDGISRTSTLLSIMAAAVVYFIMILVIRAITVDDVRLLPKGQKIEKVLRKAKLLR